MARPWIGSMRTGLTCRRRVFSSTRQLAWPRVPLGRIEVKKVPAIQEGKPWTSIWKPVLFATGLAGAAYVGAAIYTNKDTEKWTARLGQGSWWRGGADLPSDTEIRRAKVLAEAQDLQTSLDSLVKRIRFLPEAIQVPITRIYVACSEYYLNTPPSQLACLGIIGLNGLVFLAWRIPAIEPLMRTWFMHWPAGNQHRVVTLATSVFSHQSFAHYAFNSLALYSFGSAAYTFLAAPNTHSHHGDASSIASLLGLDAIGPYLATSTNTPHFLAFFLAAGLFSSLCSHLNTVIFRLPRFLRDISSSHRISSLSAIASHAGVLPSLGASGAIYATLTMTSLAFPEASVSLIFLPFIPIKIGWGVAGMVAVDLFGLIKGWRMFDHVAHLAGAAFGFFYYAVGKDFWTWLRIKLGGQEKRLRFD